MEQKKRRDFKNMSYGDARIAYLRKAIIEADRENDINDQIYL